MTQQPMQSDREGQSECLCLDAERLGDAIDTRVDYWPDNAQIIARPPLVYAGALLTVAALRWIWPLLVRARCVFDLAQLVVGCHRAACASYSHTFRRRLARRVLSRSQVRRR